MSREELARILEEAIAEYNKYHAPEAVASLIEVHEKSFLVKFSGPFCYTCGFYDYFDDFKYVLVDLGLKAEVSAVKETNEGALVKYELR